MNMTHVIFKIYSIQIYEIHIHIQWPKINFCIYLILLLKGKIIEPIEWKVSIMLI